MPYMSKKEFETIQVPKTAKERSDFLKKYRKNIEESIGRKLESEEIDRMVNTDSSPELQEKIHRCASWGIDHETFNRVHYTDEFNDRIRVSKRMYSFFLDMSGTPEADKANREFLETLTTPEGEKAFATRCLEVVLGADPAIYAGPLDLTDPAAKADFYEKNALALELGMVIKDDVCNDPILRNVVPEGLRKLVIDRSEMLQQGSMYRLAFSMLDTDFSWIWSNLPTEDTDKIEMLPSYQNEDGLGWLDDPDDENTLLNDFMKAISGRTEIPPVLEDPHAVKPADIKTWTEQGMLSPYYEHTVDGKTVGTLEMMKALKRGKQVAVKLRPDNEIEEIHEVIAGKESEFDRAIYEAYQASKVKQQEAPAGAVKEEPVKAAPIGEEPMKQGGMKEEPIREEPKKEEPKKEEPKKQEAMKEEPAKKGPEGNKNAAKGAALLDKPGFLQALDTCVARVSAATSSFYNSKDWQHFQDSLETLQELAKAAQNARDTERRMQNPTELKIDQLSTKTAQFVRLCVEKGYLGEPRTADRKLNAEDLCSAVKLSRSVLTGHARKYQEYKLGANYKEGRRADGKALNNDDIRKLKLVEACMPTAERKILGSKLIKELNEPKAAPKKEGPAGLVF